MAEKSECANFAPCNEIIELCVSEIMNAVESESNLDLIIDVENNVDDPIAALEACNSELVLTLSERMDIAERIAMFTEKLKLALIAHVYHFKFGDDVTEMDQQERAVHFGTKFVQVKLSN